MWLFLKFTWYVSFSYFDNYLLDLKNTSDLGDLRNFLLFCVLTQLAVGCSPICCLILGSIVLSMAIL